MLPTEDLFVYVYALIDDAIKAGAVAIPPPPGPSPACSDAELLAIAMVRHLLGRRSEAGFLAEVARDYGKPGRRPATCSRTRGSTARRSPPPRQPAAPPSWSRPPKTSAAACEAQWRAIARPVAGPFAVTQRDGVDRS
jgi:hypothetical protein